MPDADRELAKLGKVQQRLLPQLPPKVTGYHLAMASRPAYITTGDYHDFIHRRDGRVAVFVGDGCGYGPTASYLMVTMRAILLTHPEIHGEPGATLTAAGQWFREIIPQDLFMTGVYLLLGEQGKVSWAAAGHYPPLWVSSSGEVASGDLESVATPLGIEFDDVYTTVRWELLPGDRLLLFTDGIVEARNRYGEMFGRQRLCATLAELVPLPLERFVEQVIARIAAFVEGADFEDDTTIVCVERQKTDESH
jgi:serine phosphatase RsbU (regulator of sigma subunit)